MKRVMIIPAKAHSTRLPGKNLKPFCGHPLVAWSIVQGVNARCVDEVWVSTDSEEVADVAREYGAEVLMRNYVDEEHSSGTVPVHEFIDRQVAAGKLSMDDLLFTRLCTTPAMLPGDLDGMYAKYLFLYKHFGAQGIGVGCERRTLHISRKVVDNICRMVGKDGQCENNNGIVEHLAFMSINPVYNIRGTEETKRQAELRKLYGGDHPHKFYYNFLPWQWHDVDMLHEFEYAEAAAEKFILKGRDMLEVYQQ